jgi:hypothetical protein
MKKEKNNVKPARFKKPKAYCTPSHFSVLRPATRGVTCYRPPSPCRRRWLSPAQPVSAKLALVLDRLPRFSA